MTNIFDAVFKDKVSRSVRICVVQTDGSLQYWEDFDPFGGEYPPIGTELLLMMDKGAMDEEAHHLCDDNGLWANKFKVSHVHTVISYVSSKEVDGEIRKFPIPRRTENVTVVLEDLGLPDCAKDEQPSEKDRHLRLVTSSE